MQYDIVDCDGGLAPVVHDPVIADSLRHPTSGEVHVDVKLGFDRWVQWVGSRCVACRENCNPRFRAHTPPRSDDDPTAARKKYTRFSACYAPVHRDRLLAITVVFIQATGLYDFAIIVETADFHTAGTRPAGVDRPPVDKDIDGPHTGVMLGKDTVGSFPGRGDAAVPNTNGDVAVAAGSAISKHVFMIAIDAVGIHTLRGDRTAVLNVDVDVAFTQMMAIDAVRLGAKDVGINIRAFRRDSDPLERRC